MEKIDKIIGICALLIVVMFSSCTKYEFIDTGLAQGNHDCSMWEYFNKDKNEWGLTQEVIERAGMTDLFKKENNSMTFIGFTSRSVSQYLVFNDFESVADLDVEFCRNLVQTHVINSSFMRNDVPRGDRVDTGVTDDEDYKNILVNKGGKEYQAMKDKLFVWTYQQDYEGVPEKGAILLYVAGTKSSTQSTFTIASSDIRTKTGVVHALEYKYVLGTINM